MLMEIVGGKQEENESGMRPSQELGVCRCLKLKDRKVIVIGYEIFKE
jgi:hypothetical protein